MSLDVGKYRLIRRIAIGGMAEIFLAAIQGEAGFERRIIIKKILPRYADEPEFARRLIDEGLLASKLHHANIVQVLDLGRIGPDYFIAMEFVNGVDMRAALARAVERNVSVPIPIAAHMLWQVARALAYAHDKKSEDGEPLKIIHRDISPANVMISWEGAVKLGDFGIAKASQRLTHTMTGVLQGKFPYMSPEQAEGLELDQRSDVFSFGSVAYELLSLVRPFQAAADLQTLERVRTAEYSPISTHREGLPEELVQVVHTCLRGDPAERFANGAELERTLATVLQKNGWVVTEGDVADFLDMIFDEDRKSLTGTDESQDESLGLVEASPLTSSDFNGPFVPPPSDLQATRSSDGQYTRSVVMHTWNTRVRRKRILWGAWTLFMLFVAGVLLLDYFQLHVFLGKRATEVSEAAAPHPGPQPEQARLPERDAGARDRIPAARDVKEARAALPDVAASVPEAQQAVLEKQGHPTDAVAEAAYDVKPDVPDAGPKPVSDVRPEHVPTAEEITRVSADVKVAPKRCRTKVNVTPAEARIFADGDLLGTQPQWISVPPGRSVRVRIEADGWEPSKFKLSQPCSREMGKILKKRETGRIKLRWFPTVAGVYIDGKLQKKTGGMNILELELPVGDHVIRVQHGELRSDRTITVEKDKPWTGTITAGQ